MVNYNKEEVLILEEVYDGSIESVEALVKKIGKSKKSIIGKLAKMKIYRKTPYKTKLGEDPITKKEMVVDIAVTLGLEYEDLEGMEKTPKLALKKIHDCIVPVAGFIYVGITPYDSTYIP